MSNTVYPNGLRRAMNHTIVMTFEANEAQVVKAAAALFEITPFGECIGLVAPQDTWGDNEAIKPDEERET